MAVKKRRQAGAADDGAATANGGAPEKEAKDVAQSQRGGNAEPEMRAATVWQEAAGEYLKSMVYGGMDGIITTFAIVCAVCGADLGPRTVLSMGVANLIADAFSMGMGDYLSEKAEQDFAAMERRRELEAVRGTPEVKKNSLIKKYEEKGVSTKDAEVLVCTLAKYEEVFVDQIMINELEMMPPEEEDAAALKGVVTFMSFMLFGTVPLLVFFIKEKIGASGNPLLFSTAASALTMFSLGALKGRLTSQNMLIAGLFMMMHGMFAAYVAYFIGRASASIHDPDAPHDHLGDSL